MWSETPLEWTKRRLCTFWRYKNAAKLCDVQRHNEAAKLLPLRLEMCWPYRRALVRTRTLTVYLIFSRAIKGPNWRSGPGKLSFIGLQNRLTFGSCLPFHSKLLFFHLKLEENFERKIKSRLNYHQKLPSSRLFSALHLSFFRPKCRG